MQGWVIGGGNELAMACDIRIGLPCSKYMHPETALGTVAPLGGTKRLSRLVGLGRAKYMLLTGEPINAATAHEWKLIDFLVEENKVNKFVNDLTAKLVNKPALALSLTKESVNQEYTKDMRSTFELDAYSTCS